MKFSKALKEALWLLATEQRVSYRRLQHMGDGILMYFSYPQASEFDAERVLRSELGIVEAMPRLNTDKNLTRGVEALTQRSAFLTQTSQNLSVACHVNAGITLWLLGYPEQAQQHARDALTLATKLAHPISSALALNVTAMIGQFCRDAPIVYDYAEAALNLVSEQGFSLWLAFSKSMRGWIIMAQRQSEKGLTQMQQGLADWCATRAQIEGSYFLTLVAEGLCRKRYSLIL